MVVPARDSFAFRNLKADAVRNAFLLRRFKGSCNELVMVTEAEVLRLRIRLRHQQHRGSLPAADIGCPSARLKFVLYILKRGDPVGDQIGGTPSSKELSHPLNTPSTCSCQPLSRRKVIRSPAACAASHSPR